MSLRPETVFCKILENQYNNSIDTIESVVYFPIRALRDIRSNILRVEKLVYAATKNEVERIEKQLIEILLLNGIKDLMDGNFCSVAFACSTLVQALTATSNNYLGFIDPATRAQLSSNYDLFERNVCVLGLGNLISYFTSDILSNLRDRLVELRDEMENQLRLTDLITLYNAALNRDLAGSQSIIDLLNGLRGFANCGFETCNYAATVNNKIADYVEKLALSDDGTTFVQNVNSLLNGYGEKNDELNDKITDLISLIDSGTPPNTIPRDQIMIF